jgi:gustatory receptor
MTAWLLQYAFKLISITAPCQSATTEAENTAVLVQKLLLVQHFDQDTVTELRLFSQQLLQRKMKFTAFGFLSLDYSLLFTILGGVTTYLVVAMQYRN